MHTRVIGFSLTALLWAVPVVAEEITFRDAMIQKVNSTLQAFAGTPESDLATAYHPLTVGIPAESAGVFVSGSTFPRSGFAGAFTEDVIGGVGFVSALTSNTTSSTSFKFAIPGRLDLDSPIGMPGAAFISGSSILIKPEWSGKIIYTAGGPVVNALAKMINMSAVVGFNLSTLDMIEISTGRVLMSPSSSLFSFAAFLNTLVAGPNGTQFNYWAGGGPQGTYAMSTVFADLLVNGSASVFTGTAGSFTRGSDQAVAIIWLDDGDLVVEAGEITPLF